MEYGATVQNLRLGQAVTLILSAFALYMESDQISLAGFLLSFVFICAHLYLVLTRYLAKIDGRHDFQGIMKAPNLETQIQYAVQVFAPFVLSVMVHFTAPVMSSAGASTVFQFSHYTTIVVSFVIAAWDSVGGLEKKSS